jgi:hypothetical protein
MWNVIQSIGGFGFIIASSAAAAYWLFRTFSEKWLGSKFDERLESLKHSQQQELEALRSRVSALMDRTIKLHQREYEVLPALWEKMVASDAEVGAWVSSFQSVADVSRMNDVQLEEFLASTELLESQKEIIRSTSASGRTRAFLKENFWHRQAAVRDVLKAFSRYLRFNGIFVLPDIKDRASRFEKLLWDAVLEHEMNEEHDIKPRQRLARDKLDSDGPALLAGIEDLVQKRLWKVTELE